MSGPKASTPVREGLFAGVRPGAGAGAAWCEAKNAEAKAVCRSLPTEPRKPASLTP